MAPKTEPVTIKKYTNRRLYNTETSTYVTLEDLAEMVKAERDFVVIDAKTKRDLTHSVLTQIILEQETKGQNLMPVNFLRQLIRFYGHGIEKLVPSYLEMSLASLTERQERYHKQFGDTFPASGMGTLQEQTRKNLELFEQAMTAFTPFKGAASGSADDPADKGEETGQPAASRGKSPAGKRGKSAAKGDPELDTLKEQLATMQKQLDKLARSKR